ncbi:MAG: hypothetical protein QG671_2037 [Actinomycetota bacterium]|nr:hypothetical protein [Actinomycetota bacterium]
MKLAALFATVRREVACEIVMKLLGAVDDQRWIQPFVWGLLTIYDAEADVEIPDITGDDDISASTTMIAVPVLHGADVEIPEDTDPNEPIPPAQVTVTVVGRELDTPAEFTGQLDCPSGRLAIGDLENKRVAHVPTGTLLVDIQREPRKFTEHVTLSIRSSG